MFMLNKHEKKLTEISPSSVEYHNSSRFLNFQSQSQDSRLGKIAASKKVVPSPQRFSNGNVASASDKTLKLQIEKLNTRVDDLNLTVEGLEKERDFYFSKLRDIEIKCQELNSETVSVETVLGILYSTEDGFASPE